MTPVNLTTHTAWHQQPFNVKQPHNRPTFSTPASAACLYRPSSSPQRARTPSAIGSSPSLPNTPPAPLCARRDSGGWSAMKGSKVTTAIVLQTPGDDRRQATTVCQGESRLREIRAKTLSWRKWFIGESKQFLNFVSNARIDPVVSSCFFMAKCFCNDLKKLSQIVWKHRLKNTVMASFNTTVRQVTEMSRWKKAQKQVNAPCRFLLSSLLSNSVAWSARFMVTDSCKHATDTVCISNSSEETSFRTYLSTFRFFMHSTKLCLSVAAVPNNKILTIALQGVGGQGWPWWQGLAQGWMHSTLMILHGCLHRSPSSVHAPLWKDTRSGVEFVRLLVSEADYSEKDEKQKNVTKRIKASWF